jgi:formylglycine-generating enzyme required for sulfatase activity
LAELLPRLSESWWREPILLLAGYRPSKTSGPARTFLEKLAHLGKKGDDCFAGAELAATAALEWKDSGEAIRALCAGRIVELLDAAEAQKDSRPATRCRAGDALARLGDPRTWLLDVDQMRFCAVPGGAFWMGDKADKNAPLHLNESLTEGYWMAQAPVTVPQFRQCLTDAGRLPRDEDALKDLASRPVRHVSWHEAQDFCAWLNHRWQNRLPTGWRVALP